MAGWIFEKAPVLIETLIEVWRRGQFLGRKKRSQEQDNGTDTGRTDAAPAGERDEGHLTIVEQETCAVLFVGSLRSLSFDSLLPSRPIPRPSPRATGASLTSR